MNRKAQGVPEPFLFLPVPPVHGSCSTIERSSHRLVIGEDHLFRRCVKTPPSFPSDSPRIVVGTSTDTLLSVV